MSSFVSLLTPAQFPDTETVSTSVIAADNTAFPSQAASGDSFLSVLSDSLSQVNALQLDASARQQALNAGQSDDLAGAMVASQKASVSFSALLQVRNKLTGALDDLLNTPL